MAHGFNEKDTPHGLAKRRLIKGYTAALFARELEGAKGIRGFMNTHQYRVMYLDAFSWRGEYGGPNTRQQSSRSDDVEEDIAKMGSPIIALDRGLDRIKIMFERDFVYGASNDFKAIHYVFNDINQDCIENLKILVKAKFKEFSWQQSLENGLELVEDWNSNWMNMLEKNGKMESNLWYHHTSVDGHRWLVRTTFITGKFTDLKIEDFPKAVKTFTLIDPCGIKQIPLNRVKPFLGPDKEVFINLMVWTIRRCAANPMHKQVIQNLFGDPEADIALRSLANCPEGTCRDPKSQVCCRKRAYREYVNMYSRSIEDLCRSQGTRQTPEAIHFLFSKGKTDLVGGDQFYMVYLSCDLDLQMVKSMKDAMMSNVQTTEGGLRHTDYYSWQGIMVPFGRKTTNEEEADEIYQNFKGRENVSLIDVKRWILIKSPFTFHSRALGLLEKKGLLTVDSHGDERRRGTFNVKEFHPNQPSSRWMLTFEWNQEKKLSNEPDVQVAGP